MVLDRRQETLAVDVTPVEGSRQVGTPDFFCQKLLCKRERGLVFDEAGLKLDELDALLLCKTLVGNIVKGGSPGSLSGVYFIDERLKTLDFFFLFGS